MILVTGCAGFIGSRVCALLLDAGQEVVGIDDMNDAYDVRLKQWRIAQLADAAGFTWFEGDVGTNGVAERGLKEKPTAIIHLAARAGVRQSVDNPWVYYQTNAVGTLNLLDLCRKLEIPKFVLASTSSLYAASTVNPFHEDLPTDRPLSPYAASKKAAEALSYSYHHLYGIDVTVLRYFTVYGPAGRPDMSVFRFARWISEGERLHVTGDGNQQRDFTYVQDIAEGTIAALSLPGYEIINLGSDRPVTINSVIAHIEQLTGKKADVSFAPMHPADVLSTWADISKARSLLGWKPSTTIEVGLANVIDWYNTERSWASSLDLGN
jgi:nucleoside-diphosphate-sugar epimerase